MKKNPQRIGKLIILEGPDGVGKSKAAEIIREYFSNSPNHFDVLTFPGREENTLGKLVYDIHHRPEDFGVKSIAQTSNQVLHIAAHIDALDRVILPTLKQGKNLILDRFWWSTWVYGIASGVKRHALKKMIELENLYWKGILPSIVFLLSRDTPIDRKVSPTYWQMLSHEYDVLSEKERNKYPVIKVINKGTLNELKNILTKTIEGTLNPKDLLLNIESPETLQADLPYQSQETGLVPENKSPQIFVSHIYPAKPTIVFDTYWRFAVERQNVFFKRFNNSPLPWTVDPILSKYKFTNAYRASDRVSQFLIREVIYNESLPNSHAEVFFRIMLFKLFNKIETWTLLKNALGEISYKKYSFEEYDKILSTAMNAGTAIYSGAYIMPSGGSTLGFSVKHRNHLRLIEMMMKDELYKKLSDCSSMQKGFYLFRDYPTIGDFLAYQFITDVNYSEITDFSEMDFVVPGPGALDGIRKCFTDRGGLSEAELIRYVADIQQLEFERLGLKFQSLWGRNLQLIDCQNLFCEVDKYSRVKHPEVSGITGRTRIKQMFRQKLESIDYWYPPKWHINDKIIKNFKS